MNGRAAEKGEVMCILVKPDGSYCHEIAEYKREMLESGSSMDGTGSLRRHDPAEWLAYNQLLAHRETVPEHWVQSTQYIYVRETDRKIVGMIQLRHTLNEYLANYGGHIGYSVCPGERRRGYAAAMLRDLLPVCRALGLGRVLITCEEHNVGSERTILANGGVYESTVLEPKEAVRLKRYWINL